MSSQHKPEHKSSYMLAHGYRKGDERLSLPQIGAE